jgi:uncharacterized metal-binding protein YceD (DUF177 family)
MPLLVNLRHIEYKDVTLKGELPSAELDLEQADELIHVPGPLQYDLEAQRLENNLLVHGSLRVRLECECSRCLKPFQHELNFQDWAVHLPLAGAEKVEIAGDCVDLTPYIREDILLAFPQHPLCESECGGLKNQPSSGAKGSTGANQIDESSSAWTELNKLKL